MGWLLGRTYRLAKLADLPEVMEIVQRVVTHLDNYCAIEELDPKQLEGHVIPTRALRYITIRLGGRSCIACEGTGRVGSMGAYCPQCDGSGIR